MKRLILFLCLGLTACEAFEHPRYVPEWQKVCGVDFIKEDSIVTMNTHSGPEKVRKVICLSYEGMQNTHYIKLNAAK